jgi:hypothetical protein
MRHALCPKTHNFYLPQAGKLKALCPMRHALCPKTHNFYLPQAGITKEAHN